MICFWVFYLLVCLIHFLHCVFRFHVTWKCFHRYVFYLNVMWSNFLRCDNNLKFTLNSFITVSLTLKIYMDWFSKLVFYIFLEEGVLWSSINKKLIEFSERLTQPLYIKKRYTKLNWIKWNANNKKHVFSLMRWDLFSKIGLW